MSQKAAIYPSNKSPLQVESVDKYKPNNGEILIKNHFVASNPCDWKQQRGFFDFGKYPMVLGNDVSGEVEEVGEGVTEFKKGDKVWTYLPLLHKQDGKYGGYQQYSLADASAVQKVPASISMEEAATLGLTSCTAAMGLFVDMGLPRCSLQPTKSDDIILVWGGSSGVGSFVIQLAALAGLTVFTTCSAKNFDYVKRLGASQAFDYKDSDIVSKIRSAGQVKYVYDAISENGSMESCVKILGNQGKMVVTLPVPEGLKHEGIEIKLTFVGQIFLPQNDEFRRWFFKFLNEALETKKVVPLPPAVVYEGLDNAQKILDYHAKGVSVQKPVLKVL